MNTPLFGECEHLDQLINDFEDTEKTVNTQRQINSGTLISKDVFIGLIFGAADFGKNFKPEYKSLQMLDSGNIAAVNAFEVLYDCILDVPQLHWMLNPGGKWAQRGFALGMFFVPFSFVLYKDIRGVDSKKTDVSKKKEHIVVDIDSFKVQQ